MQLSTVPEGPEIRRAADRVARAVVGRPLLGVEFGQAHLVGYQAELSAARVVEITTYGKGMLTRFDCGLTVFTHNQLYGKWMVTARPRLPRTSRSLRFAIYTEQRWALLYSASTIEVVPDDKVRSIPFLATLGPDCLHPLTTADKVLRRLRRKEFHRRSLAALLLEQRFVAGLGNYLRSEILFEAGVHPSLRPVDCSGDQLRALARAIIAVPRRSYRSGGVTLDAQLAAELKQAGEPRWYFRHWVFRKGGWPCHRCGEILEEELYGGRHLSYCPSCQGAEFGVWPP